MTERCKPITAFLLIVMVSLVVSTRTSKQLYLTPYYLSNGPIIPYLSYWAPYAYPMPAVYPTFGQSFEEDKFVENQTRDVDSTLPVAQTTENIASQRLGFFQTFFQNLFFGGVANACPSCPSCPIFKPCQACGTLSTTTAFTTCEANALSYSNAGTITLAGLTAPQICTYTFISPISVATFDVTCPTQVLGGERALIRTPPENVGSTLVPTGGGGPGGGASIAPSDTNVVYLIVTFGATTTAAAPGSASCSWKLSDTNAYTVCPVAPRTFFSSATTGTIVSTTIANGVVGCDFSIGSTNAAATIRVTCAAKNLAAAGTTGDVVVTSPTATAPVSVPLGATGVTLASNVVTIKITNTLAANAQGSVNCAWTII